MGELLRGRFKRMFFGLLLLIPVYLTNAITGVPVDILFDYYIIFGVSIFISWSGFTKSSKGKYRWLGFSVLLTLLGLVLLKRFPILSELFEVKSTDGIVNFLIPLFLGGVFGFVNLAGYYILQIHNRKKQQGKSQ